MLKVHSFKHSTIIHYLYDPFLAAYGGFLVGIIVIDVKGLMMSLLSYYNITIQIKF
jgi:hypothetical protein